MECGLGQAKPAGAAIVDIPSLQQTRLLLRRHLLDDICSSPHLAHLCVELGQSVSGSLLVGSLLGWAHLLPIVGNGLHSLGGRSVRSLSSLRVVLGCVENEGGDGLLWQTLILDGFSRFAGEKSDAVPGLVSDVDARRLMGLNPGLVVSCVLLAVCRSRILEVLSRIPLANEYLVVMGSITSPSLVRDVPWFQQERGS
ncbi:hypothetical protein NM208_g16395 [Fusarium decemcellulare]|uniref:Uncharacterized protein n=1 Tax=Fusarium decemcellulare TaxID=57161 RepID=A0ACC1RC63_9HYPO|nr:hypothetical protein NM208_g16395 [Fusarium decemcellulare]